MNLTTIKRNYTLTNKMFKELAKDMKLLKPPVKMTVKRVPVTGDSNYCHVEISGDYYNQDGLVQFSNLLKPYNPYKY